MRYFIRAYLACFVGLASFLTLPVEASLRLPPTQTVKRVEVTDGETQPTAESLEVLTGVVCRPCVCSVDPIWVPAIMPFVEIELVDFVGPFSAWVWEYPEPETVTEINWRFVEVPVAVDLLCCEPLYPEDSPPGS